MGWTKGKKRGPRKAVVPAVKTYIYSPDRQPTLTESYEKAVVDLSVSRDANEKLRVRFECLRDLIVDAIKGR